MPRIPLVEPDHASPEVRALYESLSGDGLPVMNRMKLFGNNVDFLAALTRENRTHAPFRTDADDATWAQVGDAPFCPIGRSAHPGDARHFPLRSNSINSKRRGDSARPQASRSAVIR